MRCRTCDYQLWRTTRRACPECGTGYLPSEYRFEPAAVVFRCPHCQEGYYGTSPEGHLVPSSFECQRCGSAISMDAMSLEPARGVDESETGPEPNPWRERGRLGLGRAWLRSVMAILGRPTDFIQGLPATTPVSEAVLFAGITAVLGAAVGLVFVAFGLVVQAYFTGRLAGAGMYAVLQLTLAAANVVFAIVATLIAGVVAHGILWALRGTQGTLGRSLPAILYSYGATGATNLIFFCPCVSLIAPVWWCVAMAAMLRSVHRAPLSKTLTASIIAALTWMAVLASSAWIGASLASGQGALFGTTAFAGGLAVDDDAFFDGTTPYETPLAAVADGALSTGDLLSMIAPDGEPVSIGGLDASALHAASDETLRATSARLAAILPPNQAPFRLGRAVFVYRDAGTRSASWLAVVLPADPTRPEAMWTIARRRSVVAVDASELADHVEAENRRRAEAKRPALPDLARDLAALPDLLRALGAAPPAEELPTPSAPPAPSPPATGESR